MALTKAHNRVIAGSKPSVEDFGAIGDGVTNDSSAIEAAFNASKAVTFDPSKTYVLGTSISINPSAGDYIIDGQGCKIITESGVGISFSKASFLSTTLTSSCSRGAFVLPVASVSGVAVGDKISLTGGEVVETVFNRTQRELHTVVDISGANITVAEPLKFNYITPTAAVSFYKAGTSISFQNFEFECKDASTNYDPLTFTQIHGLNISNVKIKNVDASATANAQSDGIGLSYCSNVNISDLELRNIRYGVTPSTCNDVEIYNTYSEYCRHPVSPLFYTDRLIVDTLTGYKNTGTIDGHVAFNVIYRNVFANDTEVSNGRWLGGGIENAYLRDAYTGSNTRFSEIEFDAAYSSVPSEYDYFVKNVTHEGPIAMEFWRGRKLILENLRDKNASGVTQNSWVQNFSAIDTTGSFAKSRGGVTLASIRPNTGITDEYLNSADFDAGSTRYDIDLTSTGTPIERSGYNAMSVARGVLFHDITTDPYNFSVRIFNNATGRRFGSKHCMKLTLKAFLVHSSTGAFDILEQVYHIYSNGNNETEVLPPNLAYQSSLTGQTNESLAFTVSSLASTGVPSSVFNYDTYIDFDVALSSGRTSPRASMSYEIEQFTFEG